ncbi:TIGR03086 family metal-binding protein [Psychromicrobium lacuslunae]|uniref:Mycothiol-dependent maleylpyruvate isomerase metal-binding domain-containing protein n=1 Tax=Psychromicrobium lacuslunae TaxID=1618207 RepID=A0A0D4BZV8_9MICC|nr:TIGR03086 family metal-binding protein [Psychromicrobium lacuslunae]AJT41982.1 hypothetical protein UM93_11525 [Psychromicrobium lacuslunae]
MTTIAVGVPVTGSRVSELLTVPEQLNSWLSIVARADPRLGGEFRFTVAPGLHARGHFSCLKPDLVGWAFSWEGFKTGPLTEVLWSIRAGDADSEITVEFDPELAGDLAPAVARLLRVCAGDALGPAEWIHLKEPSELDTSVEAALAVMLDVLRRIGPEHYKLPTPCEHFTVEQLLEHAFGSYRYALDALNLHTVLQADLQRSDDYVARLAKSGQAIIEEFRHRLRGEGPDLLPAALAEEQNQFISGMLGSELFVHAWDLARATSMELTVPAGFIRYRAAQDDPAAMTPLIEQGLFKTAFPIAEDADELARVIAYTGRNPDWRP